MVGEPLEQQTGGGIWLLLGHPVRNTSQNLEAVLGDYTGKTYADASSAWSGAKPKGVIASRAGDTLPDDQCVVTHSEKAAWIKENKFNAVTDTVLLYLNCNATVASATSPGNSAASPEGRAAIATAKAAAAKDQATAAANQNQPKH